MASAGVIPLPRGPAPSRDGRRKVEFWLPAFLDDALRRRCVAAGRTRTDLLTELVRAFVSPAKEAEPCKS